LTRLDIVHGPSIARSKADHSWCGLKGGSHVTGMQTRTAPNALINRRTDACLVPRAKRPHVRRKRSRADRDLLQTSHRHACTRFLGSIAISAWGREGTRPRISRSNAPGEGYAFVTCEIGVAAYSSHWRLRQIHAGTTCHFG